MAKDFTTVFQVNQSPNEVFRTVTNVRRWWQGLFAEEIDGETDKLNKEFTFVAAAGAHYSKQKLIELVPGQKVVWLVTEGRLSYIEKTDEWEGTKIIFDISKRGDKTEVRFTHEGLNPRFECYDSCSTSWQQYLREKLIPLLNTEEAI